MDAATTSCNVCSKIFPSLRSLKQHIRINHRAKLLQCFYCDYQSKFKISLSRHITAHHLRGKKCMKKPQFICPLCDAIMVRGHMVNHYKSQHDVETRANSFIFDSKASFEKWKKDVETADSCAFVVFTGAKTLKDGNVVRLYKCSRDGIFQSRGGNQRRLKKRGSVRINAVCPASIKAVEINTSGKVRVSYVASHVGHKEALMLSDRDDFAQKLAMNMSRDNFHNSFDGKLSRLHLTTEKNIHNVRASFNLQIKKEFLHRNDRINAWINSTNKENLNIVSFYKPLGEELPSRPELLREDMVLIISTDSQIEILKKHGSNVICLDATSGANLYNLTTLMVLDSHRQGFPCVYMFSNRTDAQITALLAEIVKTALQTPLEVNVLMSDKVETSIKGWSEVMPAPKRFFYCSWRVEEAWKSKLSTIKSETKRSEVHQMLLSLMFKTEEMEFHRSLQSTLLYLCNDSLTSEFGAYLNDTYSMNFKLWAFCYRENCGIHITFLENMHRAIEYVYLGGKENSLDVTISALLRLSHGERVDDLSRTGGGKLSSKVACIKKQHQASLMIDCNVVAWVDGWMISSQSAEEFNYLVELTGVENCICEIKCAECQVCIHIFKCNCVDSLVEGRLCKHIHKVCAHIEGVPGAETDHDCIAEELLVDCDYEEELIVSEVTEDFLCVE